MSDFTWIFPLPLDPWSSIIDFCQELFYISYSVFVSMTTIFRTPVRVLIPGVLDDLFLNQLETIFDRILIALGFDVDIAIRDFNVLQMMFGVLLVVTVIGFVWSFAVRIVKVFLGLS